MKVKLLSDRKKLVIEDANFEIGIIDRGTYQDIMARFTAASMILNPRNSVKIEETATEDEKKVLLEQAKTAFLENVAKEKKENPEKYKAATAQLYESFRDFCRYGVKGHENIFSEDEKPFEFKTREDGAVADDVISVYELNGIMSGLALEVMAFNTMSEKERKN